MMSKLDVLSRIEVAFEPGKRRVAWFSVPWGVSIPIATYYHAEVGAVYWAAGGLLYSGLTVFDWMHSTLLVDCKTKTERRIAAAKALGFVLLSEGTIVFPPTPWVGYALLAILCVFNALAMQSSMVLGKKVKAKRTTEASGVFRKRKVAA